MDTRREFLKKAAMLAGATGMAGVLPPSIQKALAIDPQPGTTWLDAEHVVILMQENRSFDHSFGALQGVRGFRDPRAITLENKNPVWFQTNRAGETYGPFHLDIKNTKATWMGGLPHSWTDQLDARNGGKHDNWLNAKRPGAPAYKNIPFTMGYYDRRDLPFYYALADAFTICDQNFCSSLTGTTPNRLYLWTGTIRDQQNGDTRARVRNGDTDYFVPASWTSFPERLEEAGVDWKVYQNELSLYQDFTGEEDAWLSNFTDNPLEWFTQYQVRFHPAFIKHLPKAIAACTDAIHVLGQRAASLPEGGKEREAINRKLGEKKAILQILREDLATKTPENFDKLSPREKALHTKAFTTNLNDPHYHELTSLTYQDGDANREMKVPKGDVLHQFRQDVKDGKLPAVSWIVPPENFSDHPGAPWYGAWAVSEVLDILTHNKEVWKKTIFILCYDENDGYFDHVPPFVAPDPRRPETGKVSRGIDTAVEYVTREQDLQRASEKEARGGPIGLGYRVPLLIASPWSRGGYVNSQVFDHTSILQMLEKFLSYRTGKKIEETNISTWRRAVCGDLSSVFRPYNGEKVTLPAPLKKDATLEGINKAKYKQLPADYKQLTKAEIERIRQGNGAAHLFQRQEGGVRASSALPYELYVTGSLSEDKTAFVITMKAGKDQFGEASAGAPFTIYAYQGELCIRHYAVVAGESLTDQFALADFQHGNFDLRVYGPNGFFRAFKGNGNAPAPLISLEYGSPGNKSPGGGLLLRISRQEGISDGVKLMNNLPEKGGSDHVVAGAAWSTSPDASGNAAFWRDITGTSGWYDFSVMVDGHPGLEYRYAGRVETGKDGHTDPAMGNSF